MRVLCIDDDPMFLSLCRAALKRVLTPQDRLICCENGREGLECLDREGADIVLTDLLLPDISGLDVLARVKSHSPQAEVIVITGYATIDTAVEAIRSGARDYLTKPVDVGVLIEKVSTIKDLLDRSRQAEDYRYAKEMVEAEAGRNISLLEQRLAQMVQWREEVRKVVTSSHPDAVKLRGIAVLLGETTQDCGSEHDCCTD